MSKDPSGVTSGRAFIQGYRRSRAKAEKRSDTKEAEAKLKKPSGGKVEAKRPKERLEAAPLEAFRSTPLAASVPRPLMPFPARSKGNHSS